MRGGPHIWDACAQVHGRAGIWSGRGWPSSTGFDVSPQETF